MALRERILEAAYELFGSKGYEKTSVADIIEKAGASKGGFYHHFKTKEEILETITFSYIEMIKGFYREILDSDRLSLTEKFTEAYYRLNAMKVESVKDWERIKNLYIFEGNHLLLRKMGEAFERETAWFYEELIKDGVDKKAFYVDYPKELAALWGREVIGFQRTARKVLMDLGDEGDFFRVLQFNEQLINQQLGLDKGTIALVTIGEQYLTDMRNAMSGQGKNRR